MLTGHADIIYQRLEWSWRNVRRWDIRWWLKLRWRWRVKQPLRLLSPHNCIEAAAFPGEEIALVCLLGLALGNPPLPSQSLALDDQALHMAQEPGPVEAWWW